jgi:hypothetical protein
VAQLTLPIIVAVSISCCLAGLQSDAGSQRRSFVPQRNGRIDAQGADGCLRSAGNRPPDV